MEEEKLNMIKMKKTLSNWLFILVLLNNGVYVNTDCIKCIDIEKNHIYLLNSYVTQDLIQDLIQVTPADIENIKSAMGVFSKKL